jgi:hypothetical protein
MDASLPRSGSHPTDSVRLAAGLPGLPLSEATGALPSAWLRGALKLALAAAGTTE